MKLMSTASELIDMRKAWSILVALIAFFLIVLNKRKKITQT